MTIAARTGIPVRPRGPRVTHRQFGNPAQQDERLRLLGGSLLWISLLTVTYWWVARGGVQDLRGWTTGLDSTGRLTGLLASDLLLIQVLLMSRLPWLERPYGQDRLARIHRVVGFTSFNLMLAHVGLITWGYAAGKLLATPGTLWTLTLNSPGMLLAGAGTACLVMVALTSMRASRAQLRYESWHLLHLYAYLGVGLALPHQLWTGQEFMSSTPATIYWWGLWGLAIAAILVFRVSLPLWRSARHRLHVTAVTHEIPGTISVHMAGHALHRLHWEAGQYFTWRFLTREGWTRGHPYSLSSAVNGRDLRITVKVLGDGSAALAALQPGTRVIIEGPYGRLTARSRTRQGLVFFGAGVGITPLRALAEELDYRPGEAVFVQRFGEAPLFDKELEALSRERGMGLLRLPGRRRTADSWLPVGVPSGDDLSLLRAWIPDIADRDLFLCGPDEWTAAVSRTALDAGVPIAQIHIESFRW